MAMVGQAKYFLLGAKFRRGGARVHRGETRKIRVPQDKGITFTVKFDTISVSCRFT